ncbi:trichohyalin-like isoform X2 [Carica papaya]|uniref:trichohyalin-like isoform X2 n=1 Tax=Carica papaya TaxID=3649 RepID=UPI000B8C7810|nr:trichohyalin-like isoform X2 [Carica papaya]
MTETTRHGSETLHSLQCLEGNKRISERGKEKDDRKQIRMVIFLPFHLFFSFLRAENQIEKEKKNKERRKKEDRKEDRWVSRKDPTLLSHSVKFQSLLFASLSQREGEKYKHNRERKRGKRQKRADMDLKLSILFKGDRKEDRWVSLQDPTLLSHSVKFQSLSFTSLAQREGEKYGHSRERKRGKRQERADMDLKLSILFNVERERKEYQKEVRKKMIENKLNCPLSTILFLFQFIGSKEPNRERKEEQRKREEEDRKKRCVFLFKDPTVAGVFYLENKDHFSGKEDLEFDLMEDTGDSRNLSSSVAGVLVVWYSGLLCCMRYLFPLVFYIIFTAFWYVCLVSRVADKRKKVLIILQNCAVLGIACGVLYGL